MKQKHTATVLSQREIAPDIFDMWIGTPLAAEAKRRGISYGHLVAETTEWERAEIIRDYCAEKRRKGRKK